MAINRNALVTVLVYLVFFAAAVMSDMNIAADEFLLEEAAHATAITAPFSILLTGIFTFAGLDVLQSNTFGYIIWFGSAALNSIAIYMLAKRVYAMVGRGSSTSSVVKA